MVTQVEASGLGPGVSFSETELMRAARILLPSTPVRGVGGPSREGRAVMGRPVVGSVQGSMNGPLWVAVTLEEQAGLARAAEPLVQARKSDTATFSTEHELREFWACERTAGLRALCILGTKISWLAQEELQRDGALVARLPFDDHDELYDYARTLGRPQPVGRRATIVAPASDGFTSALSRMFVNPVKDALSALRFEVTIADQRSEPVDAIAAAAILVLLTHGGDDAAAGEPRGVPPGTREAILEACRRGAWIVHLGCNGAGTFAGGRFGPLVQELSLGRVPVSQTDTTGRFAIDCLRAGARGVLAHVDSTWSNAFEDPLSVVSWVEWIGSGAGALAWAGEDISRASGNAAIAAVEMHGRGDPRASLCWLRHVDLRGFVALGDPSSFGTWLDR